MSDTGERVEVEGPNEYGALRVKHYVTERSYSENFIPAAWHAALLRTLIAQAGGVEVDVRHGGLRRMISRVDGGDFDVGRFMLLPIEESE